MHNAPHHNIRTFVIGVAVMAALLIGVPLLLATPEERARAPEMRAAKAARVEAVQQCLDACRSGCRANPQALLSWQAAGGQCPVSP